MVGTNHLAYPVLVRWPGRHGHRGVVGILVAGNIARALDIGQVEAVDDPCVTLILFIL